MMHFNKTKGLIAGAVVGAVAVGCVLLFPFGKEAEKISAPTEPEQKIAFDAAPLQYVRSGAEFSGRISTVRNKLVIESCFLFPGGNRFVGHLIDWDTSPDASVQVEGLCLQRGDSEVADVTIRIYDGTYNPDGPIAMLFDAKDSMMRLTLNRRGELDGTASGSWDGNYPNSFSVCMIADKQPPAALPEEPETQPAEKVWQIGAPYIGVWLRDDEFGTLALRLEEVGNIDGADECFGILYDPFVPAATMIVSLNAETGDGFIYDGNFDPDIPTAEVFDSQDGVLRLRFGGQGELRGQLGRAAWGEDAAENFEIRLFPASRVHCEPAGFPEEPPAVIGADDTDDDEEPDTEE